MPTVHQTYSARWRELSSYPAIYPVLRSLWNIPSFNPLWHGGWVPVSKLLIGIFVDILIVSQNITVCFKSQRCPYSHFELRTQRLPSIRGNFPSKVVIHLKLSSIKSRLPSKVAFHQRLSSIKGSLPSKVIFLHRMSSSNGCLQSNFVLNLRSSSIIDHLPSKVIFHHKLSSIKVRLPSKVVLH